MLSILTHTFVIVHYVVADHLFISSLYTAENTGRDTDNKSTACAKLFSKGIIIAARSGGVVVRYINKIIVYIIQFK